MNRRLSKFSNLALLVLLIVCSNSFAQEVSNSYIDEIEHGLLPKIFVVNRDKPFKLEDRMEHYGAVGFSLSTVRDFKSEDSRGYGYCQKENDYKTNNTSVFRAGSISKSLTALVVLKLQEEGYLNIDTDIKKYLKSWKLPKNKWIKKQPVTLRNLLQHRSGLKGSQKMKIGDEGYKEGEKIFTLIEILDGKSSLQKIEFDSKPGEKYKYSNQGYNLIQLILEDITGKPFEQLAKEYVFQDFNMQNSTFETVLPSENNPSICYAYENADLIEGYYRNTVGKCAGGLFSTTEDLAKFLIKTANIISGKDNFISQEFAKQILSGEPYGLGFDLIKKDDQTVFYHTGRSYGYYSFMAMDIDRGDGFAMMVNTDGVDGFFREMLYAISNTLEWEFWQPKRLEAIDIDMEDYKDHLGLFVCRVDGKEYKMEVIQKEKELFYLEYDEDEVYKYPLVPVKEQVFYDLIDGNKIEFIFTDEKLTGLEYDGEYLFEKVD